MKNLMSKVVPVVLVAAASLVSACSAEPAGIAQSSESALEESSGSDPSRFRAFINPAPNYGLWVHGAQKAYLNDYHRAKCGGDYVVTIVVDLGEVTNEGMYVKSITFWTEGESIIQHQSQVWVGTNVTRMSAFTDWNPGTNEEGKPYLKFTVEQWFPGGNAANLDGLQIQHTMIPDNQEAWTSLVTWGDPAKGGAGVVAGLPDDPDGSNCAMIMRGALVTPDPRTNKAPVGGASFCPKDDVARKDMAKYLVRLKHGVNPSLPAPQGRFTDVSPADAPWTEQLAADRITKGCGQGTQSADGYWSMFCPDAPVPREQMAAFLVRLKDGRDWTYGADIGGPPNGPFNDVPRDDQFAGDIQRLVDLKVTLGCNDGNFCPKENVRREQMAAFLMRWEHGSNENVPGSGTRFEDVEGTSEFVNAIGRAVDEGIMEPCR